MLEYGNKDVRRMQKYDDDAKRRIKDCRRHTKKGKITANEIVYFVFCIFCYITLFPMKNVIRVLSSLPLMYLFWPVLVSEDTHTQTHNARCDLGQQFAIRIECVHSAHSVQFM